MSATNSHRAKFVPCPGHPDCMMCNGSACNLCGAGCWNNAIKDCQHDVVERHEEPQPPEMDEPRDQY